MRKTLNTVFGEQGIKGLYKGISLYLSLPLSLSPLF
jgi:hypothetical protein